MRILICYPWLELGGAPKTSISLAKGLKERGHEVYFFSKEGGMYQELLESAGVPLISAPYHSLLPYMFHLNFAARRAMKRAVKEYGIEVIHSFHPIEYFLSLFIAPSMNIPSLFTAVWHQDRWPYPRYPGRFIFVAEEFRDSSARYVCKKAREVLVIPNRVDLDRFSHEVDWSGFASDYSLPPKGIKIAFMSRLGHSKENSVFYAMNAVDILAGRGMDVTMAIAGDGSSADKLKAHGDRINGKYQREVIRFIGSVSRTPELLSWADVVFGIGRCAFEGMATSKPTLIVGENGLAGVVREETVKELQYYNFAGRNITKPRAPSDLANAVEDIINDPERYRSLSKFSRSYIMENYGYREGARRLEEVYERALEDPPLTLTEKVTAVVTGFFNGYCRILYKALRIKLSGLLRR